MSQAASLSNGAAGAPQPQPVAPEKPKTEKQLKYEAKKAKQQEQQKATAGFGKAKEKKSKDAPESIASRYVEKTPPGHKKILEPLDDEFHKAYIPRVVESAWYEWWEKEDLLKPEFGKDGNVKEKGKFVIAIPPPNVTGLLHIGHALATALQDTLIRWHRMRGYTTLYVPGCDHAGISTQTVVENMLWRREGKTRHDLGRTKFVQTAQEWKEEYHEKIIRVLRRLGASLDWSREAFTMSPELSAAVKETFVILHEQGYIYRANRLVNWCTRLNTALSNLEVDNKELEGRTLLDVPGYERKVEFGVLIHFKYPIDGSDATIEVATTRIETMLGDTGIAVHPEDPRYKDLIGKKARHPIIADRLLPVVPDTYVDKEFGTGAVKLTPAHDPNDFQLGTRHGLEFVNIMNDDGTLNQNAGPYAGQRRFDARYTVVEELTKKGLFVEKKNNPMKVPLCNKSKDVIEPLIKPQWWMKMREMADAAAKVVQDGEIKIKPENHERIYLNWMKDINDWCLSRQLWWGHQIPAYLIKIEGETADESNPELYVVARTEQEAQEKAAAKFPNKMFSLVQDPDVLDTWFSSGLWPFSTLGWPEKTHDLEHLYPTSILETGWDILFFWVARMVMFGLKLTGKVPFSEVYCHSLVRDLEGRKMSKSLGNVIDPVDVLDGIGLPELQAKLHAGNLAPKETKNAEKFQKMAFPQGIPECGADALRFSLVQYTTGGGDINFDVRVMASYRRFCNKIYQATKFVLGKLPEDFVPRESAKPTSDESLPERWILHKLSTAAKNTNKCLADREFSHSTQAVHQYWYDQLCDVYIENSKTILQSSDPTTRKSALNTLYTALTSGLCLIHPFMPFLSEELWQRLPRRPNDSTISITVAPYPEFDTDMHDPPSEAAYELVLGCSKGVRSLLGEYGVKDGGKAYVRCLDGKAHKTVTAEFAAIKTLCGKSLGELEILPLEKQAPSGCAVSVVSAQAAVYVQLESLDPAREIEKTREKLKKAEDGREGQEKTVKDMKGRDVGEGVIGVEEGRLRDLDAECKVLKECVEMLEKLKL